MKAYSDMFASSSSDANTGQSASVLRLNGGARPRRVIIDSDGDYDDEDDNGDVEDGASRSDESVEFIDMVSLDNEEIEKEQKESIESSSDVLSKYNAAVKERNAWFAAIDALHLPGNPLDILIDELVFSRHLSLQYTIRTVVC